jgi:hypothetical protein
VFSEKRSDRLRTRARPEVAIARMRIARSPGQALELGHITNSPIWVVATSPSGAVVSRCSAVPRSPQAGSREPLLAGLEIRSSASRSNAPAGRPFSPLDSRFDQPFIAREPPPALSIGDGASPAFLALSQIDDLIRQMAAKDISPVVSPNLNARAGRTSYFISLLLELAERVRPRLHEQQDTQKS